MIYRLTCCLCLLTIALGSATFASPNNSGVSGLLTVPTAEVVPEGSAVFSMGRFHTDLFAAHPDTLARYYAITVGYLPGLELTGRFNDFPNIPDVRNNVSSLLDRSVSAKYQLCYADGWSAAVGALDIGGESQIETAYYGALTYSAVPGWDFTLGAGSEELTGLFGGLRWTPHELVSLIGEQTSNDTNYGLELRPLKGVTLKGGIVGGDSSIAASYSFPLDPRGRETPCCPVELNRCEAGFADPCSQAEAVRDALVAESFENVVVGATADALYVACESRRFREQVDALGVAIATIVSAAGPDIRQLTLVPKIEDVPVMKLRAPLDSLVSVFARPGERAGGIVIEEYTDTGHPPEMVFAAEGAKKPGGGEVLLRLTSQLVVNQANQPAFRLKTGFGLSETVFIGRGLKLTARQDWPVVNDIDDKTDPVNRDALLRYFNRVADQTFIYGAGGYLGNEAYGGRTEIARFFDGGRFKLGAHYAHRDTVQSATTADSEVILAEAAWFDAEHDLKLSARGGQFLAGDTGVLVESTRYFGPTELTFFAYDTDQSKPHGGFRVFVPLPWFNGDRHQGWRAVGSPEFGYQYRTDADPWGSELLPAAGLDRELKRLLPEYVAHHLAEMRRAVLLHQPACIAD